ncbi:hypothetical protein [Acuticoccus sediminis]|uniref:hypothetical protein n=1 Tax=Acuticoccus sediminis TaxID=2184697 RepID=UPI00139081EB|nr:hypothetical protein [Acuticoccus sediminis]
MISLICLTASLFTVSATAALLEERFTIARCALEVITPWAGASQPSAGGLA